MCYHKQKNVTLLVLPAKIIYILRMIIACISHGDYYSVKELSQLELERIEKNKKEMKKHS